MQEDIFSKYFGELKMCDIIFKIKNRNNAYTSEVIYKRL